LERLPGNNPIWIGNSTIKVSMLFLLAIA
jgi:hypothetical protein